MRSTILSLLLVAGVTAAPLTDEQLLGAVRQRKTGLEQLTPSPVQLHRRTALLCRPPTAQEMQQDAANPHGEKFALLFADKKGRPAAEGHEAAHPEGTLLLKEKLPANVSKQGVAPAAGSQPELFTGMLKREKGFSPECGDWEFFTVSGDAKTITSRGRLANCIDCHQRYPDQDFTSRALIPPRSMEAGADGSILLHSRDAWVSGRLLRYEPQPHKNTLGFWTRREDAAKWDVTLPKGRYEVEVLQGCGKGSGGAEVVVECGRRGAASPLARLKFTVEDTGHFQNFIPRIIGRFEAPEPGPVELRVIPQTKPGIAVMDLRQILLRPVRE
ncbi:MAG: cytochrome P460 family protein [Verrucomicrobiales bacterium]|nr:cytochrome P460 family protein [Verrucomicrobiales bacterium]